MNRVIVILTAWLLFLPVFAGALPEAARGLAAAGRLSEVTAVQKLPADPGDAVWQKTAPVALRFTPQLTVAPGLEEEAPRSIELRALSDGKQLALRLSWPDATEDRYSTRHTARFADSLAVQFPAEMKDTLPYIGMGEPDHPVFVWFWRAGRDSERLAARGFGTLAPITGPPPKARAMRTKDGWAVVLNGPLPAKVNPLALAIATWNGANAERNGRKRLTTWYLLHVPGQPIDNARYAALLTESQATGNAARGKRLAKERGCAACHRLPGGAPVTTGPDLRLAGAQHWPGYLRRAVAEPSAFIVPGKGHAIASGEKRLSLMPGLTWTPDELDDVVSYLAGLTRTMDGGKR